MATLDGNAAVALAPPPATLHDALFFEPAAPSFAAPPFVAALFSAPTPLVAPSCVAPPTAPPPLEDESVHDTPPPWSPPWTPEEIVGLERSIVGDSGWSESDAPAPTPPWRAALAAPLIQEADFPATWPNARSISDPGDLVAVMDFPPVVTAPANAAAAKPSAEPDLEENVKRTAPGWVSSAAFHLLVLLGLSLWMIGSPEEQIVVWTAAWTPDLALQSDTFEVDVSSPAEVSVPEPTPPTPLPASVAAAPTAWEVVALSEPDFSALEVPANAAAAPLGSEKLAETDRSDLLGTIGKGSGFPGYLVGRSDAGRAEMVRRFGGSAASESAVALGLKWLAEHQNPDGSWSFDHTRCPRCQGKCSGPGGAESLAGATGLALLPFLGAGQTHKQGKYTEVVRRGLYFLVNQLREGGDFRGKGGDLYCHGLAAIALCEAYSMTRDDGFLKVPAQKSLDFIVYAQDPRGGGWRYAPKQPGDTSVVGWQLIALKSGYLAYLIIPEKTVDKVSDYLDSVSTESGTFYGYTSPGRGSAATTAIGLLCRMYLGWQKDHPALERGVAYLGERGPSQNDMYYNYYATQVMRHFGGEPWKRWNDVMRDQLVNSQSQNGHEVGSWAPRDPHAGEGGRLYQTALSLLTLEVYYRFMPMYKENTVRNQFFGGK